ncbi:hypothetical protein ACLMJK_004526 [Lecanora helva]
MSACNDVIEDDSIQDKTQPDEEEEGSSAESKVDDEDDEPSKTVAERLAEKRKMKRFRLTHAQTRYLMSEFAREAHPDAGHRKRLSRDIPGLSPRQVQVWFQNRRAKLKRLTVDDQERMMRSRILPDNFDLARSLRPHRREDNPIFGADQSAIGVNIGYQLSPHQSRNYPYMASSHDLVSQYRTVDDSRNMSLISSQIMGSRSPFHYSNSSYPGSGSSSIRAPQYSLGTSRSPGSPWHTYQLQPPPRAPQQQSSVELTSDPCAVPAAARGFQYLSSTVTTEPETSTGQPGYHQFGDPASITSNNSVDNVNLRSWPSAAKPAEYTTYTSLASRRGETNVWQPPSANTMLSPDPRIQNLGLLSMGISQAPLMNEYSASRVGMQHNIPHTQLHTGTAGRGSNDDALRRSMEDLDSFNMRR